MPRYKNYHENKTQISIYLTQVELNKLRVLAKREQRTTSQLIVLLAVEAMNVRLAKMHYAMPPDV